MDKKDVKITKTLQDTVKKNPLIKVVYFDEEGNFYFNKYKSVVHVANKKHESTSCTEKEHLGGAKQSILIVPRGDGFAPMKVITTVKDIALTMSRDEILKADGINEQLNEKEQMRLAHQLLVLLQTNPASVVDMIEKAYMVKK